MGNIYTAIRSEAAAVAGKPKLSVGYVCLAVTAACVVLTKLAILGTFSSVAKRCNGQCGQTSKVEAQLKVRQLMLS